MNTIIESPTALQWYATYTYPNAERKVCTKIAEMGVETYLPLQKVIRQWSDRKKQLELPLFPNYVFVKTTLQKRFDLLRIKELVRFVAFEGQPVSIPEKEIDLIKEIVKQGSIGLSLEPFKGSPGQLVKITRGQLAGTEGVIVQEKSGKSRFAIHVKALQQTITIDIAANHLTAV